MSGGLLDPDGAMEQVAEWRGRIDRMAAETQAMSDRLRDLRMTAADPNGLCEVTVDVSGALVDLRLGQRIQRVAPDVVARTIMTTMQEAKARLAARSREVIEETMPGSPTGRAIAERVGERLSEPGQASEQTPDRPQDRW
ncbi:YbaB/EbfC family nucleoid-associated protein [Dactylosporangium sp. AC04546]|uniref:YbaB/EbfC family nucleoid-associated protein n=1 Tax=Dactylosporangium sp. AC04546 TaxID=2862460 RepID=UPI001EDE7F03|nr:YbaB/EbfC family nucleoid-associated protein [Dactylosporangium sp. AC04546]WVK86294.1 YbaB/EbfC family nucleoid-associated protein [Dactylosporangium sp. AC04546]